MDQEKKSHQQLAQFIAILDSDEKKEPEDQTNVTETGETHISMRKYFTKHMRMYPELYRSDVSIHPSYSGLKMLPYYVVSRRRALKKKKQITRQLNREILHIVMMQSSALAGVKIDRIFSIGFPPEATVVRDYATEKERRRINQLMAAR